MTTMSEHPGTSADPPHGGRGGARRILVAIDDSEASERVADFVNRFFVGQDVEILAVNVAPAPLPAGMGGAGYGSWYPWPVVPLSSEPMYQEALASAHERATEGSQRSGVVDAEPAPAVGDPVAAILEVAQERDVALIVVGSNHRGVIDRALHGSTSRRIVRDSDRPVLVVP